MADRPIAPTRDNRVEDPSNVRVIDPLARRLLPLAVRLGVPANAVSVAGLAAGAAAAIAFARWQQPVWTACGLLASIVWLVADSLDGMVARATGTASALGRELDGLCDHGVFLMLYVALALSVPDAATWTLVAAAAAAHALQANVYETERGRFHRRLDGGGCARGRASRNPLVRMYDGVASRLDRASAPFDRTLAAARPAADIRERYREAAVPILRAMVPLSPNMRIAVLVAACLSGRMTAFLWYEIGPLSVLAALGALFHREAESRVSRRIVQVP